MKDRAADADRVSVFVSYAFFAERYGASRNFLFFLQQGVYSVPGRLVHYGAVMNHDCSLAVCLHPKTYAKEPSLFVHVLYKGNEGFDFGAHGTMMKKISKEAIGYEYYIFLNCGVIGPMFPSYIDTSRWHWSSAFTDKMVNNVGLVGTSIACLPKEDPGGAGPKVEGFAFSLSSDALAVVMDAGTIFTDHVDKTAAIIAGEYNLTSHLWPRFGIGRLMYAVCCMLYAVCCMLYAVCIPSRLLASLSPCLPVSLSHCLPVSLFSLYPCLTTSLPVSLYLLLYTICHMLY
jgi:hypothetical protein